MKTTEPTVYGVSKIAQLFPSIRKIKNKSLREKVAAVWSEAITTGCGGKGWTFDELRADMRRLGPKVDGTSFVGETRSPIRWNWRTESVGAGSCSIRDVTVLVNAQITLPRWTAPADTEPGLVTEWKRFLGALETHEAGHNDRPTRASVDDFRNARRQLVDRVESLDPTLISRTMLHPRLKQPMRMVDHLFFVAEHDDHHLATVWEMIGR